MTDVEPTIQRALELQERICSVPPRNLPTSPQALFTQLRQLLVDACDDGLLLGGTRQVWDTIRLHTSRNEFVINFGKQDVTRNQGRTKSHPHFERKDGAWFDFALTARASHKQPIEIISYSFELRLDTVQWPSRPSEERVPAYVRFDLNPGDHANANHGHRCHIHIGSEAFSIPSPLMSPLEILDLFIGGFMPVGRG